MDGKIAWLLWPRHELSPVSACFLLAAFHNSFILWWRHGRTRCARVCVCVCVYVCVCSVSVRYTTAFFRLSSPPLSFHSRMMNNNRGTNITLEALSHWSTSESPLDHRGQLQSVGSVGKTGRGRVRELRAFCVYGNYPGLLQRVIRSSFRRNS